MPSNGRPSPAPMSSPTPSVPSPSSASDPSRAYWDQVRAMDGVIEQRREDEKQDARIRASGLYQRHIALARQPLPTNVKWRGHLATARGAMGKGVVLCLLGNRGTGKTLLATVLALDAIRAGRSPLYTSAMGFYRAIKASYGHSEGEGKVIERFVSAPLLVIDELQVRGESAWADNLLTDVVDQRYGAMRDTVLVANQSPAEFAGAVGPSVEDRAREGGGVLVFDWPSFRGGAK
jgi:hypothetical protein